MSKLGKIVRASWRELEVYADSVPHFFHQDLTYLYVLEKERDERPIGWASRLKAWSHLLGLFLLGRLRIEQVRLDGALADYAGQYGLTRIQWLYHERQSSPIGVTSPLVIVRPLPIFQETHPRAWPPDPWTDDSSKEQLRYFLWLAVRELRSTAVDETATTMLRRLADILEREFEPESAAGVQAGFRSRTQTVELLPRISWKREPVHHLSIQLLVAEAPPGPVRYVPRCRMCRKLLTKPRGYKPIPEPFGIECPNGHENRLELEGLMIWPREAGPVVWIDRRSPGMPTPDEVYPPPARVDGKQVIFEWDPAELGGEMESRFLQLAFDQPAVQKSFDDIRFRRMLIAGPREGFRGLPIRPEWCDVLENADGPRWETYGPTYQLKLRGWPFNFKFLQPFVVEAPDLLVGIYPEYMGPKWRHYRLFLSGPGHKDYAIWQRTHPSRAMPWCLDTSEGWPEILAIVSSTDEQVGTTFLVPKADAPGLDGTVDISVAVAFGTTNTLLYFQRRDVGQIPEPADNALDPDKLVDQALLLVGSRERVAEEGAAAFLPPRRSNRQDRYLVPSAFWDGAEFSPLRWSDRAPFDGARPAAGFKWDTAGSAHHEARKKYLSELLFLGIPQALKKLDVHNRLPRLTLGWAFPLAFGDQAREDMQQLWQQLATDLQAQTGLGVAGHYAINESKANVRAFGEHQSGDTFLVADMGGGTMDVSLFTYVDRQTEKYHQIGSVEFAGEVFLRSLVGRGERRKYWEYRDVVEGRSEASLLRGSRIAEGSLNRFVAMAVEFLRTMFEAHIATSPQGNSARVSLVLVGNGWRLIESVSEDTPQRGHARVFREFYSNLASRLSPHSLSLYPYEEDRRLQRPADRKHLVAQGILLNIADQKDELRENLRLSKLPAGRTLRLSIGSDVVRLEWHDLVGEELELGGLAGEIKDIDVIVDSGPDMPDRWRSFWNQCFPDGIAPPPAPALRERIRRNIVGAPARLRRGPLQVLLETEWREFVCEAGRR